MRPNVASKIAISIVVVLFTAFLPAHAQTYPTEPYG